MRESNELDFGAFDGRDLTPEQWERLLRRVHEARAQALRELPDAMLRFWRAAARGGRDTIRMLAGRAATTAGKWWNAYAIRRERRAALRELAALDDRSLRDIGLSRSEIEFAVYNPSSRSMEREFALVRCHKSDASSAPDKSSALKQLGNAPLIDKSAA